MSNEKIIIKNGIRLSPEVDQAIQNKMPVVALESTIISHGMPYPQNFETALKVEEKVRQNGAVAATIAVINGELRAGLEKNEIEHLAKNAHQFAKLSRRDLPVAIAAKKNGATTVSATMIIAQSAGIKIFATGGIGGVHRGAEMTMDISADLEELAKTDVAVVCAGIKSILDIGLTLEYLETKGVPVLGFKTQSLPAFYSRESSFKVDAEISTAEEVAKILKAKWDNALSGGVVIANPIPTEFSMNYSQIEQAINEALIEMRQKSIRGKDQTPYLLSKVNELTGGKSLESNIQLVLNNAEIASQIAVEFSRLNR